MDLGNIKPVEKLVEIVHPGTGEKTGVTVTVVSLSDKATNDIKRNFQIRKMECERKGNILGYDEQNEYYNELLMACVTGWDWKDNIFHDKPPVFNKENLKAVLDELDWFKNQLLEAVTDESSFFIS